MARIAFRVRFIFCYLLYKRTARCSKTFSSNLIGLSLAEKYTFPKINVSSTPPNLSDTCTNIYLSWDVKIYAAMLLTLLNDFMFNMVTSPMNSNQHIVTSVFS